MSVVWSQLCITSLDRLEILWVFMVQLQWCVTPLDKYTHVSEGPRALFFYFLCLFISSVLWYLWSHRWSGLWGGL